MTDATRGTTKRSATLAQLENLYPLVSLAIKMTASVLAVGFLVYGVSKLFF